MKRRALFAMLLAALAAPATAAPADDAKQRQDLTAVIALQGKPCGEVVALETLGDNDYVATCKDGNRYHVYVTKAGRVTVEKK